MAEPTPDAPRYSAFLSYSHKDSAAAGRLHRRLESYRLPRRLVGRETPFGPVPARLWPIFRDRDELPAATDLSQTVREALAQSGALIVLCSAHAAASLWVAEEIETFRRLHPDRPILAAILEGDPPACFPGKLRAIGRDGAWHEPLATDLRRHGDGPRLGLLKLVAGITGLGLDDLVQRDAARRIRRVTAVTAAALIAMLVMAALMVSAVDARREAERQRTEAERQRAAAEGQIEFMLTDLRERLRGRVGALDVMTAVNAHALAYYGGQRQLGSLPPESLDRRTRILQGLGSDYLSAGNLPRALANFREAARTSAALLATAPDNPHWIYTDAQSRFYLGQVAEMGRNWRAAGRHYRDYARAADRLIAIAPGNPSHMMEMAYSRLNLGRVSLNGDHDAAAAQAFFDRSIAWFRRAIEARPGDNRARGELANAYADMADGFYAQRLYARALAARVQQYDILDPLRRADPGDIQLTYRLALAQRGVARVAEVMGDRAKVRLFRMRAYETAQQLIALDPQNADWLLFRTRIECDLLREQPGGARAGALRQSVAAAADRLRAQGNPRLAELAWCLSQFDARRPGETAH